MRPVNGWYLILYSKSLVETVHKDWQSADLLLHWKDGVGIQYGVHLYLSDDTRQSYWGSVSTLGQVGKTGLLPS